jgi:hypothetical protein
MIGEPALPGDRGAPPPRRPERRLGLVEAVGRDAGWAVRGRLTSYRQAQRRLRKALAKVAAGGVIAHVFEDGLPDLLPPAGRSEPGRTEALPPFNQAPGPTVPFQFS